MNGSGSLDRSRLLPNTPGAHDDASYNAALKGASLAFQKSTPRQLHSTASFSRNADNEALLAATSAASASRDHSRSVSRQTTGNSIQGGNSVRETEQGVMSQSSAQHLYPPLNRSHGSSPHFGVTNKPTQADPRSPSFIAATLAASRSVSPVRHLAVQSHTHSQQVARRLRKHSVSGNNSDASSVASLDLATDTTSIPPTNALISMFEKREDDADPVKKSIATSNSRKLVGSKLKSRQLSPPRAMSTVVKNDPSPSRVADSAAWVRPPSPTPSLSHATQEKRRQPQKAVIDLKGHPPTPPPTRMKNKVNMPEQLESLESAGKPRASTPPPKRISQADTVILSPQPRSSASQRVLLNDIRAQDSVSKGQVPPHMQTKPQPQASAHRAVVPSALDEEDMRRISSSSNDTFVSASSAPSPQPGSPVRDRSRPSSPDTIRPPRRTPSARTISGITTTTTSNNPPALPRRNLQRPPTSSSTLPLDSLTDAIMAGSLASSRMAPSAAPKPPPRRQTPHMRQTLRRPPSKSDDEDESRRRRKLGGGGNKHKHHEGARKRWREEITVRERKRYEGLWASNRGLLLGSGSVSGGVGADLGAGPGLDDVRPLRGSTLDSAKSRYGEKEKERRREAEREQEKEQLVANVVVRDIWTRSRLPFDELAEVWDLVDRRGRGSLERAEFVVGMWLVDQRLRGRKIPRKVSESVWGSARGGWVGELRGRKK
ncbi:hypothetical protein GGR54DRAFT_182761 [Hypoxylon sp. NC1633]|nr:hypothetical protein GGR54DRAFT_182761 [Hypoxylon sp. NC1633]